MAEKNDAHFFSFARRPRAANGGDGNDERESNGGYIITLRGNLERAPAGAADQESVLSAERVLKAGEVSGGVMIPQPSTDAYSPYAEKWKEFDRLQRDAKGSGWLNWSHWLFGGINGVASLFDPHSNTKRIERWIFLAVVAISVYYAARARYAASQLTHWPCPRCHSEWPGKKSDKEPRCAMCGLKLHQMAP
ncbi:MAG TPA: hypothetical protein VMM16_11390 [Verrucomicrobiae bacterium]|nr:hypothetical protein [Verrucomicrobiae bacterium]